MLHRTRTLTFVLVAVLTPSACSESVTSTGPAAPDRVSLSPVKVLEVGSSVRWNRKAIALFRARGGSIGRITTYVSLAQYRSVLAAQHAKDHAAPPSLAAAAAGASVVVLKQFYPLDAAAIEAELALQRAETPSHGEENRDFASGESIGRAIGATVLAFAATDNWEVHNPGPAPVGPGHWASATAPARGGYGARPFFLTSNRELILPHPPAFRSALWLAALAEVRTISDNRTAAQLAIAQKWVPFSGVLFAEKATDLIVQYQKSELEAARILAYGSAAAFDAIIACFENKFTYWTIRPSQADPLITTPVGLPNFPAYPSAHSCQTGAWVTVLTDAFPSEGVALTAMGQEAADSRVFGGLHYRFDNEAGVALGSAAGRLGLSRKGLE